MAGNRVRGRPHTVLRVRLQRPAGIQHGLGVRLLRGCRLPGDIRRRHRNRRGRLHRRGHIRRHAAHIVHHLVGGAPSWPSDTYWCPCGSARPTSPTSPGRWLSCSRRRSAPVVCGRVRRKRDDVRHQARAVLQRGGNGARLPTRPPRPTCPIRRSRAGAEPVGLHRHAADLHQLGHDGADPVRAAARRRGRARGVARRTTASTSCRWP